MTTPSLDTGQFWEGLSLMPRAVVEYYARCYGQQPVDVLHLILQHILASGFGEKDEEAQSIPAWLEAFSETPEWNLVRYLAHRSGVSHRRAVEEIIVSFAENDPAFDLNGYSDFKKGREGVPNPRRLLQFYAHRAGHDDLRALRFLVGLFSRHDPTFDHADYRKFCERDSAGTATQESTTAVLERWASKSGDEPIAVVELCIRRFAEEDKAFRRVQFRRWLEDTYFTRVCEHADKSLLSEQMSRWLGFHESGRTTSEAGGCPFSDHINRPADDCDDLRTIYDMYDEAERSPQEGPSADRHISLVRGTFRACWPDDDSFRGYIPQEGIFAEDGVEYPLWFRFSIRFGAGALGIKVHDGKHTLHDFLFLTTSTIMNDPIKLIGAAADNADLAQPDLVFQPYFSISPFSWGRHQAVKFRVQAQASCSPEALLDPKWLATYRELEERVATDEQAQGEMMTILLEHARHPLVLDLAIQYATNPDLCPIDNTVVEWPTPYIKVGELVVESHKENDADLDSINESLRFNPSFVSSAEHLPLGRLNRFRRDVYEYVSKNRSHDYLPHCIPRNQRVAVVGGGVSGLSAALALSEFGYPVTVFEKREDLGGHACTKEVLGGKHLRDPAFGAIRRRQWPNTWALMEQIGVKPISHGQAEDWFDSPFAGWFDSKGNSIKPSRDVLEEGQRFVTEFFRAVEDPEADGRTVGSLIEEMGLSSEFICTFFLGGVIHYFAGQPLEFYLNYPLRLIAWMWLNNGDREKGESIELFHVDNNDYFQRFKEYLESKGVRFETGVMVSYDDRRESGSLLNIEDSRGNVDKRSFGHVVLAIQPQHALRVLGDYATPDEYELLSQFEFTLDIAVVHEEARWMPKDKSLWKLFNVLLPAEGEPWPTSKETVPIIINLPCNRDGSTPILATYDYAHARTWDEPGDKFPFEHAVVTPKTQKLRKGLGEIQGNHGVHFCGSWSRGLTLHEDAVVTGFEAANRIAGVKRHYRILQPPIPLHEPFERLAGESAEGTASFGRSFNTILKELHDILKIVLEEAPAELTPSMEIKSIGLSSLHFARLANSLNARLSKQTEAEVDILLLLQMETVGELATYLLGVIGSDEISVESGEGDEEEPEAVDAGTTGTRRDYVDGLPREEGSESRQSPIAVAFWQVCWSLALSLTVAVSGVSAWGVGQFLVQQGGVALGWGGLPLVWLGAVVPFTAVSIAVKWLVVGRLKPGVYPLYGTTHLRWWAANLFLQAGQQFIWFPFQNSSFGKTLMRLLGGRVHNGATVTIGGMHSAVALIDADLLTIGDRSYLRPGASVQGHLFMDGHLVLGTVVIRPNASLWARSIVEPGCVVGEFGILEPHSVLSMGSELPKSGRWIGVPATHREFHSELGVKRPSQGAPDYVHTVLGLFLFPYLVAFGFYVFNSTLALMVPEGSWLRFDWRMCLAFWPALLVATFSIGMVTAGWKRLVLPKLEPGTSENRVAYRLASVRFLTNLVSRLAVIWPTDLRWVWARCMGAKLAYFAARDVPFLDLSYANLFSVERECFFSIAASADFVFLKDGKPILQSVELKSRSYVGAYSTVVAPLTLPSTTILASASALPSDALPQEGEVWVGSPASRVPMDLGNLDDTSFVVSGFSLFKERCVDLLSHFGIVSAMATAILVVQALGLPDEVSQHFDSPFIQRIAASWTWMASLYLGALGVIVAVIAMDGGLLRLLCASNSEASQDGFSRNSWAFTVWHVLTNHLMVYSLMTDLAAGSSFHLFLARLMGAKIGKGVYLANGSAIREFCFTRIDDGVSLNRGAALIAHSEQPNGKITMKEIHLGAQSSMGLVSYIVGGTALPPGCILGSLSRPFDGQELERDIEYNNTPCRKR